ncbi:uncharacterized protein N7518_001297 [Penicillium psychrosexuale]|uniref:uncharacterized protein n=1 Tax=Penicillium psychrosexuale TaxID=1002107 RepID=UPI002545050F|nr:uncharacterized protein N7518_001297 [Penicillium psychrosexuale]KAJ5799229.1 hypothetical protein N7518_001297 [Penicillium psychrosexuale]
MHYLKPILPFILAAASFASANTTTATLADNVVNTTCVSDNILQQCVQPMQSTLANCAPDDWNCQCTSSTNILDCYNNCPNDTSRKDAESMRQQNCANAKAHAPTSTSTAASAISSSRAAATRSTDIEDGTEISDSEAENEFKEHPIKQYSGLEANSIPRPEQGSASVLRMGGCLSFLSLALVIILSF